MELRDDWTWERARSFLPFDLESLARETGLLVRRRGTDSADSLARLLLMCGLPKATLSQVAHWGAETGLARMTPAAVFFRLEAAGPFLLRCLETALSHAATLPCRHFGKYRLIALDGSVLCGPRPQGVDQRLHVAYDLGACAPRWVDVTGPDEGETLLRHASRFRSGDLVLADRGYGRSRGLCALLESGASLLIRFEFSHLRLLDPLTGEPISPCDAAARLPARGNADFVVSLPGWQTPLRVIGCRNDLGSPVWLLTDLPQTDLQTEEARSVYSLRWQVELFFKRLKSLMDLDELPTRDGPTAKPWILAKLILATLAVLLTDERFSPWGFATVNLCLDSISQRGMESPPGDPCLCNHQKKETQQEEKGTQAILLLEA